MGDGFDPTDFFLRVKRTLSGKKRKPVIKVEDDKKEETVGEQVAKAVPLTKERREKEKEILKDL